MEQMITVKTKRLIISTVSNEELGRIMEKEADEGMRMAYGEMLEGCKSHGDSRPWYALWELRLRDKDSQRLGSLCFKGLSPDGAAEVGYGMDEGFAGNGYMTEAVAALARWAVEQGGANRVEAEAEAGNAPSLRVLEKAGFIPTGETGEEGPRFIYSAADK